MDDLRRAEEIRRHLLAYEEAMRTIGADREYLFFFEKEKIEDGVVPSLEEVLQMLAVHLSSRDSSLDLDQSIFEELVDLIRTNIQKHLECDGRN